MDGSGKCRGGAGKVNDEAVSGPARPSSRPAANSSVYAMSGTRSSRPSVSRPTGILRPGTTQQPVSAG